MASATITVTDTPDGKINVHIEFDPAIAKDSESTAQATAVRFIEMLKAEDQEERS